MLNRLQSEITRRKMTVWKAFAKLRAAQREADKAKTTVPEPLLVSLREEIAFHQGNLRSAVISHEAASRFPPMARAR